MIVVITNLNTGDEKTFNAEDFSLADAYDAYQRGYLVNIYDHLGEVKWN